MLVELRRNGQIIIPKRIAYSLGLEEGDRLEVFVDEGMVKFVPEKKPLEHGGGENRHKL